MLFSTDKIRSLLPLRHQGPCSDVKTIAKAHLSELRVKLNALALVERKLADAVAHCPGDNSASCSVLALLKTPETHLPAS
jgi:MerR family mercuric resistance operon transcriptional regulator